MRISDWSSDVCSSDLHPGAFATPGPGCASLTRATDRGFVGVQRESACSNPDSPIPNSGLHASVPPTVSPSITTDGWPPPTAHPWPPLQHTPTTSTSTRPLHPPFTYPIVPGPVTPTSGPSRGT